VSTFMGGASVPLSNPEDSPEALLATATDICGQALAAMPRAGEDGLEFAAPWIAHVASWVTGLVAGFCGERLGGYAGDGELDSSDLAIAQVYAASIAAPSAINAYVDFCRRSAEAILRAHWPAVLALASALDTKGTLTGAELDALIEEAAFQAVHAAELARRKKMAEMAASAFVVVRAFQEIRLLDVRQVPRAFGAIWKTL
jgi:hypothetical protein